MTVWPSRPLGELTRKIGSGATPRGGASVYRGTGTTFIRSQNVLDNSMKLTEIAHISDEAADALRGVAVESGDVLINITGDSIARCTVVDDAVLPARVSQHVSIVRTTDELEASYLQRVLTNPMFKAHLLAISDGGGTRKALTKADLAGLLIPLPDSSSQRAIAEVLGALDDKIAANTRTIAGAEDLSRILFTSMLVDSDLLPLSDIARFINGKAFTKDASGTGRVVIRIAELNSGIGGSTVYNDIEVEDQYLARPGDLLFAWSGSLTVHRWFRPEGIVNQHIFKVIPKNGYPLWLAYGLLIRKLAEFKGIAADKATTMGHIQRRHLDEPVSVPLTERWQGHDELMTALWDRALAAEQESLRLAVTRDELLPLLMSGKLRVRDVEKHVEEVV